jgi:hypothetical protein
VGTYMNVYRTFNSGKNAEAQSTRPLFGLNVDHHEPNRRQYSKGQLEGKRQSQSGWTRNVVGDESEDDLKQLAVEIIYFCIVLKDKNSSG